MKKELYTYDSESLTFNRLPKKYTAIIYPTIVINAVGLFSLITSFNTVTDFNPAKLTEKEVILVLENENKFTPDKLRQTLKDLNFVHQDIVYAQAKLETQHFTSNIFKYNNNLFGMKEAMQRCTTNLGTERNHAKYATWYDSVIDYAMYQSKYTSRFTREQYFQYLEKFYAEDPNYVPKLKKIIKTINYGN